MPDVVERAFRAGQRFKEFLLMGFEAATGKVRVGEIKIATEVWQLTTGERTIIGPKRAADLFALVLE
jgi:hypothetical protein